MMMGIGNLTELTDADTGGVNVLLAGFCQEIGDVFTLVGEHSPRKWSAGAGQAEHFAVG